MANQATPKTVCPAIHDCCCECVEKLSAFPPPVTPAQQEVLNACIALCCECCDHCHSADAGLEAGSAVKSAKGKVAP